jgi:hypothetical protein
MSKDGLGALYGVNKNLGKKEHQTDKHLPQSPFRGKFF